MMSLYSLISFIEDPDTQFLYGPGDEYESSFMVSDIDCFGHAIKVWIFEFLALQ